ncbi:MAG: hypothetical protein ACOX2O_10685 [Bdellovibrionota bacterium]|jgi:hypothetical protein
MDLEAKRLELRERQLHFERRIYENKLAISGRNLVAVEKKYQSTRLGFNKIRESLKKINSTEKDPRLIIALNKNYTTKLSKTETILNKLKLSINTQRVEYKTLANKLNKIIDREEKILSKVTALENKKAESLDEAACEESVSADLGKVLSESELGSDVIQDCDKIIEDLGNSVFNQNQVSFNSETPSSNTGQGSFTTSSNDNHAASAQSTFTNQQLLKANIDYISKQKINGVENIDITYLTTDNSQIAVHIKSGNKQALQIEIIPQLLKHRLSLWNNTREISQALRDAGINLNSLKVYGRK